MSSSQSASLSRSGLQQAAAAKQFSGVEPPPMLSWLRDWRLRAALGAPAAGDDLQLHLSLVAAGCLLRAGRARGAALVLADVALLLARQRRWEATLALLQAQARVAAQQGWGLLEGMLLSQMLHVQHTLGHPSLMLTCLEYLSLPQTQVPASERIQVQQQLLACLTNHTSKHASKFVADWDAELDEDEERPSVLSLPGMRALTLGADVPSVSWMVAESGHRNTGNGVPMQDSQQQQQQQGQQQHLQQEQTRKDGVQSASTQDPLGLAAVGLKLHPPASALAPMVVAPSGDSSPWGAQLMYVGQVAVVHVLVRSNMPQPLAISGAELVLGLQQPRVTPDVVDTSADDAGAATEGEAGAPTVRAITPTPLATAPAASHHKSSSADGGMGGLRSRLATTVPEPHWGTSPSRGNATMAGVPPHGQHHRNKSMASPLRASGASTSNLTGLRSKTSVPYSLLRPSVTQSAAGQMAAPASGMPFVAEASGRSGTSDSAFLAKRAPQAGMLRTESTDRLDAGRPGSVTGGIAPQRPNARIFKPAGGGEGADDSPSYPSSQTGFSRGTSSALPSPSKQVSKDPLSGGVAKGESAGVALQDQQLLVEVSELECLILLQVQAVGMLQGEQASAGAPDQGLGQGPLVLFPGLNRLSFSVAPTSPGLCVLKAVRLRVGMTEVVCNYTTQPDCSPLEPSASTSKGQPVLLVVQPPQPLLTAITVAPGGVLVASALAQWLGIVLQQGPGCAGCTYLRVHLPGSTAAGRVHILKHSQGGSVRANSQGMGWQPGMQAEGGSGPLDHLLAGSLTGQTAALLRGQAALSLGGAAVELDKESRSQRQRLPCCQAYLQQQAGAGWTAAALAARVVRGALEVCQALQLERVPPGPLLLWLPVSCTSPPTPQLQVVTICKLGAGSPEVSEQLACQARSVGASQWTDTLSLLVDSCGADGSWRSHCLPLTVTLAPAFQVTCQANALPGSDDDDGTQALLLTCHVRYTGHHPVYLHHLDLQLQHDAQHPHAWWPSTLSLPVLLLPGSAVTLCWQLTLVLPRQALARPSMDLWQQGADPDDLFESASDLRVMAGRMEGSSDEGTHTPGRQGADLFPNRPPDFALESGQGQPHNHLELYPLPGSPAARGGSGQGIGLHPSLSGVVPKACQLRLEYAPVLMGLGPGAPTQAMLPPPGTQEGVTAAATRVHAPLPGPPVLSSSTEPPPGSGSTFTWAFVLRQPAPTAADLGSDANRPRPSVMIRLLAPVAGPVRCGDAVTFLWQLKRTTTVPGVGGRSRGGSDELLRGSLAASELGASPGLARGAPAEFEVLGYQLGRTTPTHDHAREFSGSWVEGVQGDGAQGEGGEEQEAQLWPWSPAARCATGSVRLGRQRGAVALIEVVLTPLQQGWVQIPQLHVRQRGSRDTIAHGPEQALMVLG